MEPKKGPSGEYLKWEPTEIPSTKPFVNISTAPEEPLSSYENMNFIKTKSLVYSPFHPTSRNVNFDIGYSKDAKWLEPINDKWDNYSSFFIGGFFEAVYPENNKIYAQIDAKLIDFDVRFRNQSSSNSVTSPVKASANAASVNAFALRRSKSSASPTTSRSVSRSESVAINNTQDDDSDEEIKKFQKSRQTSNSSTPTRKHKLSNLYDSEEEPNKEPQEQDKTSKSFAYRRKHNLENEHEPIEEPVNSTRRRKYSGLQDEPIEVKESTDQEQDETLKSPSYRRSKRNSEYHEPIEESVDSTRKHKYSGLQDEPVEVEESTDQEQDKAPKSPSTRKRKLSDLCNLEDEAIEESADDDGRGKGGRGGKKGGKGGRGGRGGKRGRKNN